MKSKENMTIKGYVIGIAIPSSSSNKSQMGVTHYHLPTEVNKPEVWLQIIEQMFWIKQV